MSYDEAVIEDIKADLNHLDETTLQSIRKIIDRAKRPHFRAPEAERRSTVPLIDIEEPLPFVGENLTPEEYEKLTLQERSLLQWRLQQQNRFWLKETFAKLKAAWIVVVDRQVIASGKSLKNLPMQTQVRRICRRTGKFPFIFVNDKFITIEEITAAWSTTNQARDYYPTFPLTLRSAAKVVDIVGDFDTGASNTFVDYDFLTDHNLIQPQVEDYPIVSLHLSQRFAYVAKWLQVEVPSNSGETRNLIARVFCVSNWNISPFVEINPNRTALIGRDILLELKPQVLLDFAKRQTEIVTAMKTSRTRKKVDQKKKRSARPRRRD